MQSTSKCIDKLNGLLQGEISAVETYGQALEAVTDPIVRAELQEVQRCHAGRVAILAETVASMGKQPAHDAGPWGAFAKTLEGGAKVFGQNAAIGILEEGEDKGLNDYRNLLEDADATTRPVIEALLPRQEETHAIMSCLKRSLH
jgi:uncharacterized protein (TIGR02284 family)